MAGPSLSLRLAPNAATPDCVSDTPIGREAFGSTAPTTNVYVGRIYVEEINDTFQAPLDQALPGSLGSNGPGLELDYTLGKLVVACRGGGKIELVDSCSSVIASISCDIGNRPWTAASDEFTPYDNTAFNLRVRANPGQQPQWANPVILLW